MNRCVFRSAGTNRTKISIVRNYERRGTIQTKRNEEEGERGKKSIKTRSSRFDFFRFFSFHCCCLRPSVFTRGKFDTTNVQQGQDTRDICSNNKAKVETHLCLEDDVQSVDSIRHTLSACLSNIIMIIRAATNNNKIGQVCLAMRISSSSSSHFPSNEKEELDFKLTRYQQTFEWTAFVDDDDDDAKYCIVVFSKQMNLCLCCSIKSNIPRSKRKVSKTESKSERERKEKVNSFNAHTCTQTVKSECIHTSLDMCLAWEEYLGPVVDIANEYLALDLIQR